MTNPALSLIRSEIRNLQADNPNRLANLVRRETRQRLITLTEAVEALPEAPEPKASPQDIRTIRKERERLYSLRRRRSPENDELTKQYLIGQLAALDYVLDLLDPLTIGEKE